MFHKLWVRLSAAFLFVVMVAVLGITLVNIRSVDTRFRGYIERDNQTLATSIAERLEAYYAEHATWKGAELVLPVPIGQPEPEAQEGPQGPGPSPGEMQFTIIDQTQAVVYASDPDRIGQPASETMLAEATPLTYQGDVVGWILVEADRREPPPLDAAQSRFLTEVQNAALLVALLAGGLALGSGIAISRLVTRPLSKLTNAAQAVAQGNLGEQVAVSPGNASEIIALADAFNSMSQALADGEAQRQRMTADIAHELRTPLTVMRGHLQSIMDGVRPPTIENVAIVYDQSIHLSRLVEDLRTLTQAEAGHLPLELRLTNPADLLNQAAQLFEPVAEDAGLILSVECSEDLPQVNVDSVRLRQVLENLITNALRHTDSGGRIQLKAHHGDGFVRFWVTNSGVSLTPDQVKHIFERFWRADESRQRDGGGAGLGLSIARQIIRLHGGSIWVELDEDRTHFIFELPAAQRLVETGDKPE
jgi:signal transduction histidine kinase